MQLITQIQIGLTWTAAIGFSGLMVFMESRMPVKESMTMAIAIAVVTLMAMGTSILLMRKERAVTVRKLDLNAPVPKTRMF